MSHPGYACLCGMEIWNQERVGTYAAAGWSPQGVEVKKCNSCGPELAFALGEKQVYSNPGTDKAPWFAASEPESFDFGGFYVMSVDGLGPGIKSRSSTPRASGIGSVFGPEVQASPVIVVTGLLMARTCCAAQYGLRWLTNVLSGTCDSDCDGCDLTFLECCPEWCEDAPDYVSYEECLEPYIRTLKGVVLTSGPTITDRIGATCGCGCASCDGGKLLQVTFTLSASMPCAYREPVLIESGVAFNPDTAVCHTWIPTPSGQACVDECAALADCITDPLCTPAPTPPSAPPATNSCICTPFSTVTACIDVPAATIPDFAEGVPIITVSSGSQELRQVTMQFHLNPLGQDPTELDPCNACGEVTLSRIPPYSVFTMDGTNRTVTITCPGRDPVDATPLLGQRGGRLPFRFPEIPCGGVQYTMCVSADSATVAPDASIGLSIVTKDC